MCAIIKRIFYLDNLSIRRRLNAIAFKPNATNVTAAAAAAAANQQTNQQTN